MNTLRRLGVMDLIWLAAVLVVMLQGCVGRRLDQLAAPVVPLERSVSPSTSATNEVPREDPYVAIRQASSVLGWVAGLATAASAGLLLASAFVPFIPRRGAAIALGLSLGLGLARYALLKYGVATAEVAFWLTVGAAGLALVFVAMPAAIAWRHATLAKVASKLAVDGDARAAVALEAESGKLPTKDLRVSRLAQLTGLFTR